MATLLVVDDDPASRSYLVTLLGYGEHRVLEAQDGEEALAVVRAEHPDLVLADILMPVVDGFEFVRRLRQDPEVSDTRVIFCTAHYRESQALELARACGIEHVLTKPCPPDVVLRVVSQALGAAPPTLIPQQSFDQEHLRLLTDKLSGQTAQLLAINARLKALIELGIQFGVERNPERLLLGFCEGAQRVFVVGIVLVGILDAAGTALKHFMTAGIDPAIREQAGEVSPRPGPIADALRLGRPIRGRNPGHSPGSLGLPASFPPLTAYLAAPIVSPTRRYGWLCLANPREAEAFNDADCHLATTLGTQLGRVYENGSLYADLLERTRALEQEIQERRRTEETLRLRDRAIAAISQAILITDPNRPDNPVVYANPGFERMTGYPVEETLGRNCRFLQGADTDRELVAEVRSAVSRAEPISVEVLNYRKDGSPFWNALSISPIWEESSRLTHFVGVLTDVTERRRLEEQFRQAQKMEAIGRLAGGIAHDFNNLLTVINGYSEIALSSLRPADPLHRLLGEIRKSGERAAALTRQLLTFSRKQVLVLVLIDLNGLLNDMSDMLRRLIGENIQLRMHLEPNLWLVRGDAGQMEQVVMNLVVNARDAMEQGGTLTIETANVRITPNEGKRNGELPPGDHVLLMMRDTGSGMTPEVKARIFEPFFTTKGPEQGTGLGLATVYAIVQQAGGHIEVDSEAGRGTTFRLYFPRSHEKGRPSSYASTSPVVRGTETILVVEDEDGVRHLLRLVLQQAGYKVLEAQNGGEAILVCEEYPDSIPLLITDVILPTVGGTALAERLLQIRKDLKILYISGYTEDAVVRHGITEGMPFLQKPFTPEALLRKVREVLDGPAVGA